jgi:hypothetical protein
VGRLVGSALDAPPWGTVHVLVALVLDLAVMAAVGVAAVGVGRRAVLELRFRRLVRALDILPTLPTVE